MGLLYLVGGIVAFLLVLLVLSEVIRAVVRPAAPGPPPAAARAGRDRSFKRPEDFYRLAAIQAARYRAVPVGRVLRPANHPNQIRIVRVREWNPDYDIRPIPAHRRGGQIVDGCIFDYRQQRIIRYVKLADYHF